MNPKYVKETRSEGIILDDYLHVALWVRSSLRRNFVDYLHVDGDL